VTTPQAKDKATCASINFNFEQTRKEPGRMYPRHAPTRCKTTM